MARLIVLASRATAVSPRADLLRGAVVGSCALALILAKAALPF